MTHRAVAYTSTAVAGLGVEELDRLLVDARANNRMHGVTGVLLHDGRRFFQYFEGPEDGVARIYARIRASRMHVALEELHDGPVARLHFPQWHMGCAHAERSVLLQLGNQQWQREAAYLRQDVEQAGEPPGLRELLAFWERQQAGAGHGG